MFTVVSEFNPGTRGMICLTHSGDLRKDSPTGLTPHEHAVDLGISLDFEGGLAVCESCVIEMGDLLGLQTRESVDAMVAAFTFDRDWEAAHRENAERDLKNALDAVRVLHLLPAMIQHPDPVPKPDFDDHDVHIAEAEKFVAAKRGPGRPPKVEK